MICPTTRSGGNSRKERALLVRRPGDQETLFLTLSKSEQLCPSPIEGVLGTQGEI